MKKKNILIIGSNEFFSLEKMYSRAFKSLGCKVNIYHAYDIRKSLIRRISWKFLRFFYFIKLRSNLINFFKKNKTKYDLVIVFKGIYLNSETILNCKDKSKTSKWINIYSDDPFNISYFKDISNKTTLESLNSYDFFFIWSKKIANISKTIINKNKISYLPFAYDKHLHKISKKTKKKYDISFIGTADKLRYETLKQLNNFKVLIAGDGWKYKKFPENFTILPKVNAKLSSKVCSQSKICLNLLRPQNIGSHNMKTFEIPAMGGLLLTKRSKEQNNFFPENIASLMYGNSKEIIKKINLILVNDKLAQKIKHNAKKRLKFNSYEDRSKYILERIEN